MRFKPVIRVLRKFANNIDQDRILIFSGYVAYATILALFPFLVFLVALAGFLGGPELAQDIISRGFAMLPDEVMNTLAPVVRETVAEKDGSLLTFGIVGTLWAASSGIESMRDALNIAHHLTETRSFVRKRLQGLGFIIAGSLVFLLLAVLLIGLPIVLHWVGERFPVSLAILVPVQIVRFVVSFGLLTGGILIAYRVLPDTSYRWRALLPGALAAAALWIGLASLFSFYLTHFGSYNVTYGSLGGIIATIAFFQLSMLIILIGAEINVLWHGRRAAHEVIEPGAQTPADQNAMPATA